MAWRDKSTIASLRFTGTVRGREGWEGDSEGISVSPGIKYFRLSRHSQTTWFSRFILICRDCWMLCSATIRPHRMLVVHGCGILLQMLHVAWSVSVCRLFLCSAHPWAVQKRAEPIAMPFGGWLMWIQGTMGMDTFEGGHLPAIVKYSDHAMWMSCAWMHCALFAWHCGRIFLPCARRERMHSPSRWVTRQRCGLLPN